ncbi:sodium-dependent transporter [Clostridium sp. SYSU_GA19001]|uniref:sodium-dependent transporter n=1 Tax=Clostridium caldaquaticum TaxID=2940653 RepID=UPI0020776154|nr:sodium-dependent transporter [Clostridium caldaquaticum]MCM8710049.1 sodium-dependent transporter [Clostridium caldaquaticum]
MTLNSNQKTEKKKRETFSTGLAVFFATLGSAVGLGNIWKFPYLTGNSGGGAFVFTYLICILLVGIPVMVAEFYIGRKTRKNAVGAFTALKASPFWKIIGYMGAAASLFIMFFYSSVAGWVYSYVFKALTGKFGALAKKPVEEAVKTAGEEFSLTVGGTYSPVLWQFIVIAVVSAILIAGVQKGIERVTKTLMPLLFLLIIICDIRAITLPKASQGLQFLFNVDFSKINAPVILTALGLAFFKLSLGMGTMITYGSYFTEESNLMTTSARVAVSDTIVSLLSGIAIFPVVFEFGMKPGGGPGLLFQTIPLAFSRMPLGNLLLIAFFLLAAIAATTAMISMLEVPIAILTEEKGMGRTNAVLLISSVVFIIGAVTVHPESIFGGVTLLGKGFFDLFDYISSNILLPVGGLLISVFAGYFVSKSELCKELSNNGIIKNKSLINIYHFVVKFVTPILLIIVFLSSIGIIKLK